MREGVEDARYNTFWRGSGGWAQSYISGISSSEMWAFELHTANQDRYVVQPRRYSIHRIQTSRDKKLFSTSPCVCVRYPRQNGVV